MRKNDCLETPEWVYKPLGFFDLDPCASSNTNIGQVNYEFDGLNLEWFGFVWCNPPFSQKQIWIDKMVQHNNGILLLPERGSAPWFGPLVKSCTKHFILGKKINFIGGPSSNNVGSVLFLFGKEAVSRIRRSRLPGHLNSVEFFNPRK